MAALPQSAVVINRAWNEAGPAGRDLSCRQVTLTMSTSAGTVANPIAATLFGLTVIEQSSFFVQNDNTVAYQSSPNFLGTLLLFLTATTGAPVDLGSSVVIKGIVKGY